MVVASHDLIHLSQVDHVFCFETSYFSLCIPELLNKSFVGPVAKGVLDMCSLNRLLLILFFHLYRSFLACFINLLKTLPLCIFSCTTTFSLYFIGFLQSFIGISSSLSKGLLVPLPLILFTGVSCKGCPLKSPLGIDDPVKGLLPLISTTGEGEGKRSFFPFFLCHLGRKWNFV
jgi:hypothetical protein